MVGNELSTPDVSLEHDVSRERTCFETSPQQLMATKDQEKDTHQNFDLGRLGSFSGAGREIQTLQNMHSNAANVHKFHTSKVCMPEDQNSQTEIGYK